LYHREGDNGESKTLHENIHREPHNPPTHPPPHHPHTGSYEPTELQIGEHLEPTDEGHWRGQKKRGQENVGTVVVSLGYSGTHQKEEDSKRGVHRTVQSRQIKTKDSLYRQLGDTDIGKGITLDTREVAKYQT